MAHVIVVAALIRGDRVLLGHRRPGRSDFPDCWALPGGHVESGERLDDALVRESKEEIGVDAIVSGAPSLHLERQHLNLAHPEYEEFLVDLLTADR